jgi:apolipoprotein N-acyltransferase
LLVVLLTLSFLVAGLVEPIAPHLQEPYSAAGVVHTFIIAILLYSWCKADAAARQAIPPSGAVLLVAFVPPLGIPYYLLRSRPWRRAFLAIAAALGLFVLQLVLFELGYAISEYLRT